LRTCPFYTDDTKLTKILEFAAANNYRIVLAKHQNYVRSARVQVWLQVEPGDVPVEDLIHLMLDRYGHHPGVIGVGVDSAYSGLTSPYSMCFRPSLSNP